jgi:protein-L-isoaspartate(D-aspartate) O-methyltransferase
VRNKTVDAKINQMNDSMANQDAFTQERAAMVQEQIEQRGIHNPRLLDAMRRIPRHRFIPQNLQEHAYQDGPLPIGLGQTISQPYIVAAMTDLLELSGDERVLEIGTGSGYQAAVLSAMARAVHTIERHAPLAQQAEAVLRALGYDNVFVHTADGSFGWPSAAPYQAVLVAAAVPRIPEPLIDQMDEGSRLVIPVGYRDGQMLERWRKAGSQILREAIFPVAFVPFRGKHGWADEDWQEE